MSQPNIRFLTAPEKVVLPYKLMGITCLRIVVKGAVANRISTRLGQLHKMREYYFCQTDDVGSQPSLVDRASTSATSGTVP